jgi:hypothetical protein
MSRSSFFRPLSALLVLTAFAPLFAGSEPLADAASFVKASSLFGQAKIVVARMDMRIARKGGELSREVELSLDRSGAGSKSLARIMSPAFLSGMKFLKISSPGQADAQWLKTSRGIRRLGESNRSDAVFDSDFSAEDFGSISDEGFDFAFAPGRDTAGSRAVEAKPRAAAPYALRVLYIDNNSKLLMGIDYLDASGAAIKRYRVTSVSGSGADIRPDVATMEDLRTGGTTRLKITSFATPDSLPGRIFNSASL